MENLMTDNPERTPPEEAVEVMGWLVAFGSPHVNAPEHVTNYVQIMQYLVNTGRRLSGYEYATTRHYWTMYVMRITEGDDR